MKRVALVILVLINVSCQFLARKTEFTFKYQFENKTNQSDISHTIKVLNKRLNKLSLDHKISALPNKIIQVKIKAITIDSARIDKLIMNQGKLEFWELYKGEDFNDFIMDVDSFFAEDTLNDSLKVQPLFSKIVSKGYKGGPVLFEFKAKDTAEINKMINHKDVRFLKDRERLNSKFMWGIADEFGHHPLYAIKATRNNKPPLSGNYVIDAIQSYNAIGNPTVSISMNKKGAFRWERLTGKAFSNKTFIAVALNDMVYMAPGVTVGAIKGGKSEINGDFTRQEAQDLAVVLSSQGEIPQLKRVD